MILFCNYCIFRKETKIYYYIIIVELTFIDLASLYIITLFVATFLLIFTYLVAQQHHLYGYIYCNILTTLLGDILLE